MKKKNTDIPGQMSFCVNTENFVVQANSMINGRQSVGLSAAKILRAVIMQVKPSDTELNAYHIPIGQLATMIGANRSTLTHDVDKITDEILTNPICIKEYDASTNEYKFIKIPWLEICVYTSKSGLALKLNEQLKPYVLQLSKQYTQYILQDVLQMKSVYAVRVYELLMSRIQDPIIPKDGIDIEMTIDEIRTATDTQDKFERYSNLKKKVIEKAEEEILRTTTYKITHAERKTGKQITSLIFHVTMQYY